jgi:hypothetical protein
MPGHQGQLLRPPNTLASDIETSEEAHDLVDAMAAVIDRTRERIRESYADDCQLDDDLSQAAISLREAAERIEHLEENRSPRGQAFTVVRTALRRYVAIDPDGPIGEDAARTLDRSLGRGLGALRRYSRQSAVDPEIALIALNRCDEILRSDRA